MKTVLILGAKGFIGRFLSLCVKEQGGEPLLFDLGPGFEDLASLYRKADYVIDAHGLNRSEDVSEFHRVNVVETLRYARMAKERDVPYLFLSSILAGNGTPYGDSKLRAEEELEKLRDKRICWVRLFNVFGPICRRGYNSVIATWADAAARGERKEIVLYPGSRDAEIAFLYVADLAELIITYALRGQFPNQEVLKQLTWKIRLSDLHNLFVRLAVLDKHIDPLTVFSACSMPAEFLERIYGTFLYAQSTPCSFHPVSKEDERGSFIELVKGGFGDSSQVSLNIIYPNKRKGGHYHHHKVERFVRLDDFSYYEVYDVFSDRVSQLTDRLLDVPPFIAHSIVSNAVAPSQVVIWSSEPYLATQADTYRLEGK